MPSWLVRLLSLAALTLAALGALLGLVPFTEVYGLILLVVALVGAGLLLWFGRRRFGGEWPRAGAVFSWWTVGLAVIAVITVLIITGAFGSCAAEVDTAAAGVEAAG
jgi:hypothetical protein